MKKIVILNETDTCVHVHLPINNHGYITNLLISTNLFKHIETFEIKFTFGALEI